MAEVAAAEPSRRFSAPRQIAARVDVLARDIAASSPRDLIIVAVLKGSFIFAADLDPGAPPRGLQARDRFHLPRKLWHGVPCRAARSRVLRDVETDLAGREVVIVDDILDSGRTLAFAKARLEARGARRSRPAS